MKSAKVAPKAPPKASAAKAPPESKAKAKSQAVHPEAKPKATSTKKRGTGDGETPKPKRAK